MSTLKEKINRCLSNLKSSGKFCSIGSEHFVFPQLHIKGIGELGFPINTSQSKELIKIAHKAPFGKGKETILDATVRSAWEIDASELHFEGENWLTFLNKILVKVKEDLGITDAQISAHLYKMLIYEEGDFFLKHKDTEKEKGMFGTLIIGLPSTYTGGELQLSFEGEQYIADFTTNPHQLNYTAFYADCDHEVNPLHSGYRICLVYNLVQQKTTQTLSALTTKKQVDHLVDILYRSESNEPLIILLGHQYTPENFSVESLKLNDRLRADVLLKASTKLGFYSKLCLVTSFVSGAPEYNGYGDDNSVDIDEIYDEWLEIKHWVPNEIPFLYNLTFSNEDLIASFPINEGDPVEAENTGYMGNYGPDINHWYHYGAVVVWSKEVNAQHIENQKLVDVLDWIAYFNTVKGNVSTPEKIAIDALIQKGGERGQTNERFAYEAIGDWIINKKPEQYLHTFSSDNLRFYFEKIPVEKWVEVLEKCSEEMQKYFFAEVIKEITPACMKKWMALCRFSIENNKLVKIVTAAFENAPVILKNIFEIQQGEKLPMTAQTLSDLIVLQETLPKSKDWSSSLSAILTDNLSRNYLYQVLVPALLEQKNKNDFTHLLLDKSKNYLQHRVDNQPQAPQNWARDVPSKKGYEKQWNVLRTFLEDPDMQSFDFRRNQSERDEMKNAIINVVIDLQTQTIKKGSPHTLRITKTQEAYNKAVNFWKEDVILLEKVIVFMNK